MDQAGATRKPAAAKRLSRAKHLFRLTAGDGTVVAVSPRFTTINEVADRIEAVRENAATGLVVNHSSSAQRLPREEARQAVPKAVLAA